MRAAPTSHSGWLETGKPYGLPGAVLDAGNLQPKLQPKRREAFQAVSDESFGN